MHHAPPVVGHAKGQAAPRDLVVPRAPRPDDVQVDLDVSVPVRPVVLVVEAEGVDELVHDGAIGEALRADGEGLGGPAGAAHVGGAAAGAGDDLHSVRVRVRGWSVIEFLYSFALLKRVTQSHCQT